MRAIPQHWVPANEKIVRQSSDPLVLAGCLNTICPSFHPQITDDEALALAVATLTKRQEQGLDISAEAGIDTSTMHEDEVRCSGGHPKHPPCLWCIFCQTGVCVLCFLCHGWRVQNRLRLGFAASSRTTAAPLLQQGVFFLTVVSSLLCTGLQPPNSRPDGGDQQVIQKVQQPPVENVC